MWVKRKFGPVKQKFGPVKRKFGPVKRKFWPRDGNTKKQHSKQKFTEKTGGGWNLGTRRAQKGVRKIDPIAPKPRKQKKHTHTHTLRLLSPLFGFPCFFFLLFFPRFFRPDFLLIFWFSLVFGEPKILVFLSIFKAQFAHSLPIILAGLACFCGFLGGGALGIPPSLLLYYPFCLSFARMQVLNTGIKNDL